jgi:hypothetical protein
MLLRSFFADAGCVFCHLRVSGRAGGRLQPECDRDRFVPADYGIWPLNEELLGLQAAMPGQGFDAVILCKPLRSFLATKPSRILPRHLAALAVEVQAFDEAVFSDLHSLWFLRVGHDEIDRWKQRKDAERSLPASPGGSLLPIPAPARLTDV